MTPIYKRYQSAWNSALISQGKAFKFSFSTGSNFCFSLDTREEAPVLDTKMMASAKKKPTPSTLRRNARRRAEFLNKKLNPAAKSTARPLKILPSPTASTERRDRKVVSMEKDHALPSFSQLDGATTPSSTPGAPPSHPCPPAPFDKRWKPQRDDIAGAEAIYGKAGAGSSSTSSANNPPATQACSGQEI